MSELNKLTSHTKQGIMQELLEAVSESYQDLTPEGDHPSLQEISDQFDLNPLKVRKLLITAGVYESAVSDKVNRLFQSGKSIQELMDETGLSRASVHSYLPYVKAAYKGAETSETAERIRKYRERKRSLKALKEDMTEENLWNSVVAFQSYPFRTLSGLPFKYTLKAGRSGRLTKELWIDRRENSKSLAWSSVMLAFRNAQEIRGELERPKALGDIRGISYIYPIFWRFGIIRVPEKNAIQMEIQQRRTRKIE